MLNGLKRQIKWTICEFQKTILCKNITELENPLTHIVALLQNHKTSKQNDDVIKRLDVIRNAGDYDLAK